MSAHSCRHVRADLSAYLDGDLDAGLADKTRAHLAGCAACRSELELLRLTVGALHRLPDLPPPAAILSGVRARLRPEPWHRRLFGAPWHFNFPLGAAATLLVAIGISLLLARYPEMPKSVAPGPILQAPSLPAKKTQAVAAPDAPPAPAARENVARRRSRVPSAPPAPAAEATPPAAAPKDAGREDASVRQQLAAAPSRAVIPAQQAAQEPAKERTVMFDDDSAVRAATGQSAPIRDSVAADEIDGAYRATTPATARQKESRALLEEKADSGGARGSVRVAEEREPNEQVIEVVCQLRPGGDTASDLEQFLRREGAFILEVSALEPPALREAAARHRERLGRLSGTSRGWTMTVRVQAPALARLLEALAQRTGLRILEQPAIPATAESSTGALELRLTVLQ